MSRTLWNENDNMNIMNIMYQLRNSVHFLAEHSLVWTIPFWFHLPTLPCIVVKVSSEYQHANINVIYSYSLPFIYFHTQPSVFLVKVQFYVHAA